MITEQKYTIKSYVIIFFILSFMGWCYELILDLINKGILINQGFFIGPYLPIYGSGGICVIILLRRFHKKPIITFFLSMGICVIIEYSTSYILELIYHKLWWDYSNLFLNLNGRIALIQTLLFGGFCLILNYFLAPFLNKQIIKLPNKLQTTTCICLISLFIIDFSFSILSPQSALLIK